MSWRPIPSSIAGIPSSQRADRQEALIAAVRTPLALVVVASLWALCHPYVGIIGDAGLYIGRALANLDQAGLGRDMAFAADGQSKFSLFPILVTPIVAKLGAAKAAMLVAIGGSATFLAAVIVLARSLATGRTAIAIMLVIAVLPVGFGANVLGFGETSAVPRPFAEAAVLAALAAVLSRREGLAGGLLVLALVLHPIVAMAGLGVAAILLVAKLWRATRLGVAAMVVGPIAVVLTLAFAGVSPLDRLFVRVDPDWFAIIVSRSPYLFPTLWDASAFAALAAQITTIVVAAHLSGPTRRLVLLSIVVSALTQLAAAAVLADTLHSLVAVQAQIWRATWLVAVVGGACLVLCAEALWRDGPANRVALILLGLAWFVPQGLVLTLVICGVALVLRLSTLGARLTQRHAVWVAAIAAPLLLVCALAPFLSYAAFLHALPSGAPVTLTDPLRNNLQTLPLVLLVFLWLLSRRRLRPEHGIAVLAIGALGLTSLAALVWDQRSPFRTFVETRADPPGFGAMAAGRSPEVLWLGALAEPWTMLGRPQYFSAQQAPGLVFSRPLAMQWRRRADVLVGLGLVPNGVHTPWSRMADTHRVTVTADKLAAFCRRSDAPGTVVVPFDGDEPASALPDSVTWWPPAPSWTIERHADDEWRKIRGWTAIACGPRRSIAP